MKKLLVLALALLAIACLADELAVGTKAPAFSLVNAVDGKKYSFQPGDGKISVVFFTCNQCPYNAICTESWSARQVRGGLS